MKYFLKGLALFCLLLLFMNVNAQIDVEGTVCEKGIEKGGVSILHYSKGGVSEFLSNIDGKFSFLADQGDVVQIRHHDFTQGVWISEQQVKMAIDIDVALKTFEVHTTKLLAGVDKVKLEGIFFDKDGPLAGLTVFDENRKSIKLTDYDGSLNIVLKPGEQVQFNIHKHWFTFQAKQNLAYAKYAFFYNKNGGGNQGELFIRLLSDQPADMVTGLVNHLINSDLTALHGGYYFANCKGKHQRELSKSTFVRQFYLMKKEVSNEQFCGFLNDVGVSSRGFLGGILLINPLMKSCKINYDKTEKLFKVERGFDNFPVTNVTWSGARSFSKWCGGRLPYYCEWQYATALSGCVLKEDFIQHERFKVNSEKRVHPVASMPAYPTGLFDLLGNVQEWCLDGDGIEMLNSPSPNFRLNPTNQITNDYRTIAGSAFNDKVPPCSFGAMDLMQLKNTSENVGFRVAFDNLDY